MIHTRLNMYVQTRKKIGRRMDGDIDRQTERRTDGRTSKYTHGVYYSWPHANTFAGITLLQRTNERASKM